MQIFTYTPPSIPWLDIRYQDRDIIVINKPSGLLSNPGRAANTYDCALNRLLQSYPEAILVHRLDCATSGIMVFALNKKAESNIKTQFQNRMSKKVYIAEVQGLMEQDEGLIELAMKADKARPPLQEIATDGKPSKTYFKVIERRKASTLVELKPVTGRTHQLRLHMLALGHTILGDDFYGDKEIIAASNRLRLHAMSLTISHPFSNKEMTFKSFHPFHNGL
ncbi:RNA pseudouridine synthase [Shewanella eurypsychrophilus]|uniref:Dual-specificity RNA pseudouridine synthase RluA n=1 Tax=Shewanella eurypsychrophilus TaxID=2593656 RepID=A0ABX6VAN8_9GAMM|nr:MULTISPECIES: pseudouridine synthase [Shewanella]QFU23373.1 RNA pseudouridine synthase [Shewanella sp. YLB-09]QPG58603.1 RNA pseudouridine synthase [Shewanella eurypsychrophilus]